MRKNKGRINARKQDRLSYVEERVLMVPNINNEIDIRSLNYL